MSSERDNCGLSSILPISCRDRAEAFARSLQSRLSSLGGHGSPNNERSWLGPHERPVTLSQPLQTSSSVDRFYDLEQDLDSPQSPQDELEQKEFHILLNKDNLNGFNAECHCPKFEDSEKRQFFVKTNDLTKCTSNDSVNSEIFYDLDDDPPSINYVIGLKKSDSSSVNDDLNSQGTSSSNQSEAYCTSLDCTPQPSLTDDPSTLSIQKLSDSSITSDLNGLSETSSDQLSSQSSTKETERVNGYEALENSFDTNTYECKYTNGCREEINIEYLVGDSEVEHANGIENGVVIACTDCANEKCEENGQTADSENDRILTDHKYVSENRKLYLDLKSNISIALKFDDTSTVLNSTDSPENKKDCETTNKIENNCNETEDEEINGIDETDLKVIGNDGDGFTQIETLDNRLNIDETFLSVEKDIEGIKIVVEESNIDNNISNDANDDNDDDDNDDEDIIPRLRRCSSLKTGKTPPGTPGRKKIVRFADVLGLDLADVRTFLDEIPKVPKSAYDDLSDVDITDSSDLVTLGGTQYHGIKTDRILVPMFEQPAMLPNFLDLVRDFQVCLENAFVDDPVLFSIRGFVRVRNLDFHKSVHIRYSLDSWTTFSDVQATYCSNSCDGFSDKFSFILYANTLQVGQKIEMACRFQCKGCQYWDNNKGKNYVFQCLPAAANPTACPSQAAVRRVNTHDDWGASFY